MAGGHRTGRERGVRRSVRSDAVGRLAAHPIEPINLVLRSPVFQSAKIRDIGDLDHGLVNERCVIDSPIVFPARCHVERTDFID